MQSNKDLLALKSTVGDEDVLTVTANGNASPGSYDLNVTQLAKAAKVRATPTFADRFDEFALAPSVSQWTVRPRSISQRRREKTSKAWSTRSTLRTPT